MSTRTESGDSPPIPRGRNQGTVPSVRPVPAWYATMALGTAAVAGLVLPGRPAGLGLSLVLLTVLGTAAKASPRDRWTTAWWALAAVLALMPFVRTAGWVVAASVLGALGLGMAAAGRATSWARLFSAPGGWFIGLIPGPFMLVASAGRGTSGAVVRGAVGGILLVGLFGSLLVAADAAFADVADSLVPHLGSAHPAVGVLVAAGAGAFGWLAGLPAAAAATAREPVASRTETRIALGALALLFAAFVAVQAATLFGGDGFVRRTADLTYAEYARSGFWLLLVVAGLTLGVIAAAVHLARPDRWLLGALGVLTLVILLSAWHRLGLYVDAYGDTRARAFAAWSIAWLAGLFLLVLASRANPRTVVTWSAILGVAFGLSNPDGRIAAHSRDAAYRSTLSDDAGGRCVARDGGLLSLTLPQLTRGC